MSERRWQPPPMELNVDQSSSKVTVDEKVVRKMLAVNPSMRKGRTTFQVKKALERGESVAATDKSEVVATGASAHKPTAKPGAELQDAIDFFLNGKAKRLAEAEAELAAKRQALDAEAVRMRQELQEQVRSFISLLDLQTVAATGKAALGKHVDFLKAIDLTPAALVDAARKDRR
ncbi:MAG: hypothetical protein HY903_23220 [Deltaproteobacteria bacterium]|nr:hypothetical protein [Deltaproteobacteria bacterium]